MAKRTTAAVTPKPRGRPSATAKAEAAAQARSEERAPKVSEEEEQGSDDEDDDNVTVHVATTSTRAPVVVNDEQPHELPGFAAPSTAHAPDALRNEMPSSSIRSSGKLSRPSYSAVPTKRQVKLPPQQQSSRSKVVNDPSQFRVDPWDFQGTPESKAPEARRAIIGHDGISPTKKQKREQKRQGKARKPAAAQTESQHDAVQADRQLRQEEERVLTPQRDDTPVTTEQQSHTNEPSESPQTSRKRKREELQRAILTGRPEEEHPVVDPILTHTENLPIVANTAVHLRVRQRASDPITLVESEVIEKRKRGRPRKSAPAAPVASTMPQVDNTSTLKTAIKRSPKKTLRFTTPPPRQPQQERSPAQHRSSHSPADRPVREGLGKDEALQARRSPRVAAKKAGVTALHQMPPPKPARIDPQELIFGTQQNEDQASEEDEDEDEDAVEDDIQDTAQEKSRANGQNVDETANDDVFKHRYPSLYKLKTSLQIAVESAQKLDEARSLTLEPRTEAILKLCETITAEVTRLQDGVEGDNDSSHNWNQLNTRLNAVRGVEDMADTQVNQKMSDNVFCIIIPSLVRLVYLQSECYIEIDLQNWNNAHHPLTIHHVNSIIQAVHMVLEFANTAKLYPRSAKTKRLGLPIKLRSNLNKALQTAENIRQAINDEQLRERHEELVRFEDEEKRRICVQQQEQKRLRESIQNVRERWRRLHEERRAAEGGFVAIWARGRQEAYDSLRDPDYWPMELDSNGEPFRRLQVFLQRSGPPPQMVAEARAREWSPVQIQALGAALKRYAEKCGPDNPDLVLVKVFRSCCYQRGPLVEFNVTDIVTKAADLKAFFLDKGYQGDWIEAIPDWVKPITVEGIENGQY